MSEIKIGIVREGRIPVDRRVPLLPNQCLEVEKQFNNVKIFVQPSDIRCISNKEYSDAGLPITEDLSHCEILLGVKEVPIHLLIPNKTYLFFSHTIKKQSHNQKLLQALIEKKIRMIDYECLTDSNGNRIIAFGRYAGVVGAYNGLLLYGKKYNFYNLKRAYKCFDINEIKEEIKKVKLPPVKIAVTGGGRVANGAMEVLDLIKVKKVTPEDFINIKFETPVYCQLNSKDYHLKKNGDLHWESKDFYSDPGNYASSFSKYFPHIDILVASAYWDPKAPRLFAKEDMRQNNFNIKVIADITCDIGGSIPSTIKPTTIYDPAYDYNVFTEGIEAPYSDNKNITVMAIDNLPGELPRDASRDFGSQLINNVLPHLFSSNSDLIKRATLCEKGLLTPPFSYLEDFLR